MKRPLEIDNPSFTSKRPKRVEYSSSLTSKHKGQASKRIYLCCNMSEQYAKERDKLVLLSNMHLYT